MSRPTGFFLVLCLCLEASAQVPPDGPGRWTFPQTRISNGYSILIHAPQIRSWPEFERFTALAAVEVTYPDANRTEIGTIAVEGDTRVDLQRRLVLSTVPKVTQAYFETELSAATRAAIDGVTSKEPLEIPLDLFLAQVSDRVLASEPPAGFNFDPPPIHVATTPTALLIVGGEPVLEPIGQTGLQRLVNTNWPVFRNGAQGAYFLLYGKTWLTANTLEGQWTATQSLPDAFSTLPDEGGFRPVRAAIPPAKPDEAVPRILFTAQPAELIVIDGPPRLAEIEGAEGLHTIENTDSALFKHEDAWYFLASGRWFKNEGDLFDGKWTWQRDLPGAFADIPVGHPAADIRASVPGTPEARMAALEAELPVKKAVAPGSPAPVAVAYGGEPAFERIPETSVSRAANSDSDVIEYDGTYYLLQTGAWYSGPSPTGPWNATGKVPQAVYAIPPSSPSYHVTQVTVNQITEQEIVYTYPASYPSGIFIVYGMTYYGTGWYYPPWYYGGYYYPYPGSYGHGSYYNPRTGRYGSHSRYYGPYGGASYTSGYNPRTGRYSERYSGWDGDEWGSYRESYNPRTGVATETSRYFDDDTNKLKLDRSAERGNTGVRTTRTTDFDDGASYTKRETTRGGQSDVNRNWGDGQLTTSGNVTTGDGRTATIEGSHDRSGGTTTITGSGGNQAQVSRSVDAAGVSREGTFTRDGQTATTQTRRSGGAAVTDIQTSAGGTAKSAKIGAGNRVTVGQSSSGDLYAASNGKVYKPSGDRWASYENGKWRTAEGSPGSASVQQRREQATGARNTGTTRPTTRGGISSSDRARLDRDRRARRDSQRSYERRRAASSRSRGAGGFNRGGFSRGGSSRGGGRRR